VYQTKKLAQALYVIGGLLKLNQQLLATLELFAGFQAKVCQ
jgi:hypothetical protein